MTNIEYWLLIEYWLNILAEYWLVIFRGSGPILLRKPIFLLFFRGVRTPPSGSAYEWQRPTPYMVPVHCTSTSHGLRFKINERNIFKIVTSETTRPRVFIFGMKHHLVNLHQVCSRYGPGTKYGPTRGSYVLHYSYKGKACKSCQKLTEPCYLVSGIT